MTLAERDAMILAHAYLVPMTRKRIVPKALRRVATEDLEGAGYLGLVKAADRYDPARGVRFTSWAISMIRGEMWELLRREDWVPRSVRAKQKRGEPVLIYDIISWEDLAHDDDECSYARMLRVVDKLIDPAPGPEERVLEAIEAEELWQEVGCLPADEREAICAYYGEELTFAVIGKRKDRSLSRAKQWHGQGLARLRERVG